ncbi:MAG TPA: DUF4381 family protein [Steroidobacteraceae bacterium]|nr:DUF4381 family protein [Steroidobacteraceae bacterium]
MARTRRITLGYVWPALLAGAAVAQAGEDIRDIRGPKAVSAESWAALAVVGAIVIVAICVYVFRRERHRGPHRRSLTLTELALERLEETRPLMRSDSAREFGIAASEVIRDYIERRFAVSATRRTTEEFLQALLQSSNEALAQHRALLAQFLQQCDFVKFAGASLGATDLEALLQSARGFVLATGEPATGEPAAA